MIDFEYKTSIYNKEEQKTKSTRKLCPNKYSESTSSFKQNYDNIQYTIYNIHAGEEPVDKWWKYNNSGQGEGSALRIYPPKCAGLCSCRKITKMKKKDTRYFLQILLNTALV